MEYVLAPQTAGVARFERDRLTHLNYAMVGTFAFMAVVIGPVLPSLRSHFGLSYTEAGLVPATLAAGVGIAGLVADRIIGLIGGSKSCWFSACGFAASAALMAVAPSMSLLFVSLFAIGLTGGVLLSVTSTTLSTHHGEFQATAVVEANVVAGVASLAAPVAVAVSQHAGFGWQPPLFLPLLAVAVLYAVYGSLHFAKPACRPVGENAKRLPRDYWLCWLLLMMVVALEGSLNVWGAQYFQSVVGLSRSTALLAPVFFYIAFLTGRVVGSILTQTRSEVVLLRLTLLITLCGVCIYWLVPLAVPAMLGYAAAGFGVANLWPLTLSLAIHSGKRKALGEAAAARASSASGLSTLTIPPILGAVADKFGLHASQVVIVVLALGGLFLLKTVSQKQ